MWGRGQPKATTIMLKVVKMIKFKTKNKSRLRASIRDAVSS